MDQRVQFIAEYQRAVFDITELARRYGISRKTAYKWIERYEIGGPAGLVDRSRRPAHCPHRTPPATIAALLEVRRHHPTWGAKKLLKVVATRQPTWTLPARSTVCDLLDRAGLITAPGRRRVPAHPGRPLIPMTAPNGTWTADFKGQFKTRNGVYCYPLTVVDGFSRYLLACHGLLSTAIATARPIFLHLFQEYGLPGIIRTDNGVPFATTALGRLSTLSVWWIRLGILPELIAPASPQQNGRHERMHRTLKAEATRPPAAISKRNRSASIGFVMSTTTTVRTKPWIKRRPVPSTSPRPGRSHKRSRPWNTPDTSKSDSSVAIAVSAGRSTGSASRTPWQASTSDWKKSTMGSGTYTSGQ